MRASGPVRQSLPTCISQERLVETWPGTEASSVCVRDRAPALFHYLIDYLGIFASLVPHCESHGRVQLSALALCKVAENPLPISRLSSDELGSERTPGTSASRR